MYDLICVVFTIKNRCVKCDGDQRYLLSKTPLEETELFPEIRECCHDQNGISDISKSILNFSGHLHLCAIYVEIYIYVYVDAL